PTRRPPQVPVAVPPPSRRAHGRTPGPCACRRSWPVSARVPGRRTLARLLDGRALFGPFSIDTIFPAFPAMGADLGADKLAMQQTISVYLVAYALMSLVHGPLSDLLGRRRVILSGLVVFALASTGCALATDMPTLLAFRGLQGLSAGVGLIVGRAGDRANQRRLAAGLGALAADLLVPGRLHRAAVAGHLALAARDPAAAGAAGAVAAPAAARLRLDRAQSALPAPGRGRCVQLR